MPQCLRGCLGHVSLRLLKPITRYSFRCSFIRPRHAGASWTSLASSSSENQVQAGDDSLQVPTRIGNLCHCWQSRQLRSACTGMLSVPRTRTTLGMRSFAVAGLVIWNSLPAALQTATISPLTFARQRLIDSSSEDHLWRALQIYSSSPPSSRQQDMCRRMDEWKNKAYGKPKNVTPSLSVVKA